MEAPSVASQAASPPTGAARLSPASREIRLGLVVYGGVSLAIYINGVANELFRAHRGRGVYKLLKRLLDSEIVVDIISGTSAGGINGLLLAFALTNEREFGDSAALWREHGSLSRLLRLIDDDVNTASLLDSKNYYLPHLERAFRTMGDIPQPIRRDEWPAGCDELDLFVTGTSFDGQMSTAVDATGRRIDIKSHRTVFHLKHRRNRKEPFAFPLAAPGPNTEAGIRIGALARLAAITSCFPAAFEPVKVAPNALDSREQAIYERLCEWGRLSGESWFLDGGVLDNKPFSYTIREIFNRTALRPVSRTLMYVEPDPERFAMAPQRAAAPHAVLAATQALFGIPGYESIADDLEQIATRNDRLARTTRARHAASAALRSLKAAGVAEVPPSVAAIYRHTRLAQLSNRAVAGLMEGQGFKRPLNQSAGAVDQVSPNHDAASALARAFAEWDGDGDDTLERYDVYMRRRRIFHVIYQVFGRVSNLCDLAALDPTKGDEAQALQQLWWKLNRQLSAYDIVAWGMERALDAHTMPEDVASTSDGASAVWRALAADFDDVLHVTAALKEACDHEVFAEEDCHALHTALKQRSGAIASGPRRPAVSTEPNLLQRLDAQTAKVIAAAATEHPHVAEAYRDFDWFDAHFFPIDYFGDLGEKDAIDIVRVSPLDAERAFSSRRFEDKITGETVMHFGAFLKKSWRSNDIMWGRLDGACRILDTLLTESALRRALRSPEVRTLLARDVLGELAPSKLFPGAGKAIQRDLETWLNRLASDDEQVREAALADRSNHDLVLWCAQLEILNEDLPTVLEDAATEQLEWNNVRTDSGFTKTPLRLDRAMSRVLGRQVTQSFIKTLRDDPSEFTSIPNAPIAKYFNKEYAVGAESPQDDIPPAVLAETITAALLVARNCLVNAFPGQGERLRGNLLFRAVVEWPLAVAHTLAVFARRERTVYLAALSVLFTYAVLALIGGVIVLDVDLKQDGKLNRVRVVSLVVIPVVILVVGGYLAWLKARRHQGRSWSGAVLKATLYLMSAGVLALIALAFGAAWTATNDKLRFWIQAAANDARVRWLLPDSLLDWLAATVRGGEGALVTLYPLILLVVILVVAVPALRGFIQSRMAKRTAVISVTEAAQGLYAECRHRLANVRLGR
jgi:patatin-related protein